MSPAPSSDLRAVQPRDLKRMIGGEGELAILDVREEGTFGDGHLLFAASAPLSRLEMIVDDLVPRKDVAVVLVSGGDKDRSLVRRGAEKLQGFGYGNLAYLDGGVEGWRAAGFEVFSGVNVPSKAFGEFVEARYGTPHVAPAELKAMQDRGDNLVVVDSRPMEEFRNMCIPGGVNVPGAELALRIHDIAPDPATTVVVNCAGRTRSIIGAQSLINAGIPNRVAALENGTMGWHLAGFELERGQTRRFPEVSKHGQTLARAAAERVARRFGVREIDAATLNEWRKDKTRTLYLLDVRDPGEYEAGHLLGSRPAPGGQLVQATDRYVAVRGARLVLCDDNGVRARMTASWLLQMGWNDVHVLKDALAAGPLVKGSHVPRVFGLDAANPESLTAKELAARMVGGPGSAGGFAEASGAVVVDLADSRSHRAGHVPAARFAIRANMPGNLNALPQKALVVLTSADGVLARLAAADAKTSGRPVRVLAGGTAAWKAAGQPLAEGFKDALDAPVDVWYRPYDLAEGTEEKMRQYLAWEVGLSEAIARDGTARFRDFTVEPQE